MVCIPCFSMVSTSEIVAVQRCGRLNRFAPAGCILYLWPWETFSHKESLRQEVVECTLKTKTVDNVFVDLLVACNYKLDTQKIYQAYYSLTNRKEQMKSFLKDGLRVSICSMTLDQAYAGKEEVSKYLKESLSAVFKEYGIIIMNVLIRELTPDAKVMNAMNDINASKRELEAVMQRAEGEKTIKIKRAEADAEAMLLSGQGVARQRKAIMDGLKSDIVAFSAKVEDTSPKDVMDLLILNQYFDALEVIGSQPSMRTIMLPSDENGGAAVRSHFMEGMEGIKTGAKPAAAVGGAAGR